MLLIHSASKGAFFWWKEPLLARGGQGGKNSQGPIPSPPWPCHPKEQEGEQACTASPEPQGLAGNTAHWTGQVKSDGSFARWGEASLDALGKAKLGTSLAGQGQAGPVSGHTQQASKPAQARCTCRCTGRVKQSQAHLSLYRVGQSQTRCLHPCGAIAAACGCGGVPLP